jgi:hypothetical protein
LLHLFQQVSEDDVNHDAQVLDLFLMYLSVSDPRDDQGVGCTQKNYMAEAVQLFMEWASTVHLAQWLRLFVLYQDDADAMMSQMASLGLARMDEQRSKEYRHLQKQALYDWHRGLEKALREMRDLLHATSTTALAEGGGKKGLLYRHLTHMSRRVYEVKGEVVAITSKRLERDIEHFGDGWNKLRDVDLLDCSTEQKIGELLAARVAEVQVAAQVMGGRWQFNVIVARDNMESTIKNHAEAWLRERGLTWSEADLGGTLCVRVTTN